MTHHPTAADAAPDAVPAGTPHDGARRASGLAARSVAEGVGSFLVILVGLGATMLATETSLQPTLVFGFAVVAAMIAFGSVSGGHFNPAITIGSAVAGRTDWKAVLPYLVAQVLGAVAASGLIWLVLSANAQLTDIGGFFSSASNGFDEHSAAQFPLTSAFLLEVVAAALLVAVFLGARSQRGGRDLAPFAVGLTYAGLLSFLLPVTNGGVNPVRSTASAVFAEPWALQQLWLFWAAPVVGGMIAGLVFRSLDAGPSRTEGETVAAVPPAPVDGTAHQHDAQQDAVQSVARPGTSQYDGPEAGGPERPVGDAESFFDAQPSTGHDASRGDDSPGGAVR
ncbi:hypothetical protein MN0502_20700 [Arthrobacter sp. MN05-02]|nr:hypothetical protein MN0502_20700 [Arthrobacter sp. MN05-02]